MLTITGIGAFADNYIWTLTAAGENRAAVVDPGDAEPVRAFLRERDLQLGAIVITHHHPDHTGGVNALLGDVDAPEGLPVYGPAEAANAARLTNVVGAGDTVALDWLDATFDVISVPGHTAGHIAFHGEGLLFSGDTLFRAGCGRLFEGDAAQMRASMQRLRDLPEATQVYCGHEYTEKNLAFASAVEPDNADIRAAVAAARATRAADRPTLPSEIAAERAINPFMRWDAPAVIGAAERRAGRALGDADEVFAIIRQWKDAF